MTDNLETSDEIWSFIEQKLQTPVPPYFKYVLKYCGYENGVSIASIDDVDIKYFVEKVRNGDVINYYKSKLADKDVLKGSVKNMENFDFSLGHRKFLMYIVTFLKNHIEEHGNDSFSQTLNSSHAIKRQAQQSSCPPRKILKRPNTVLDPSEKCLVELPHADLRRQEGILIRKTITSLINHAPETYVKVSVQKKHNIEVNYLQSIFILNQSHSQT